MIWEFFAPASTDSLSLEFEWEQVSGTLQGIIADLGNVVIWMVYTFPLISKSSGPFISPLEIVSSVPITSHITVTFMFHSFFHCPFGWGCRIHQLVLCWGVRLPHNEWPGYDTKQSDCEITALGNAEYPFIAIAPRSILAHSGSTWQGSNLWVK